MILKKGYITLARWVGEYMPVIFMGLAMIALALFGNLILEATKVSGNSNLYIPAWVAFSAGLVFAALAYYYQRREDRIRETRENEREQREIERHNEFMKQREAVASISPSQKPDNEEIK